MKYYIHKHTQNKVIWARKQQKDALGSARSGVQKTTHAQTLFIPKQLLVLYSLRAAMLLHSSLTQPLTLTSEVKSETVTFFETHIYPWYIVLIFIAATYGTC